MTTPGAPEAPMTSEQRIKEADRLARQNLKIGLGAEYLGYDRLFHAALALQFAKAIREAESSALRRAAKHMKWRRDNYRNTAGKVADDPAIIPLLDAKADACDNAVDALLALIPPSPSAESATVIEEIAAERMRQVEVERYGSEHDDDHEHGELAKAAMAYCQ